MDIATILRSGGLRVVETSGWKTRVRPGEFAPVGVMNHHTASRKGSGNAPSLGTVVNGRPDLHGPLCNVLVARDGACYVVSAGRANHAGLGSSRVLALTRAGKAPQGDARTYAPQNDAVGNGYYVGVEVENDGVGEPYPQKQLDAVVAANAALLKAMKRGANCAIHHREWTSRKIDMSWRGDLRGLVQKKMASSTVATRVKVTNPYSEPTRLLYLTSQDNSPPWLTGRDVQWAQWALGFAAPTSASDLKCDGVLGPATESWIRRFQAAHPECGGVDGKVGPDTRAAMRKIVRYRTVAK